MCMCFFVLKSCYARICEQNQEMIFSQNLEYLKETSAYQNNWLHEGREYGFICRVSVVAGSVLVTYIAK